MSEIILEGLPELPAIGALIPAFVIFTSFIYLASRRSKLSGSTSCDAPATHSPTTADFDISNIRVTKILIHPIKSCRGTSVQQARYTLEGFQYDRKWCIVDARDNSVVTARQLSKMVLIHPRIVPGSSLEPGRLEVCFPEGSGCEPFSVPLNPGEEEVGHLRRVGVSLWGKKDIDGYICESLSGPSPSIVLSEYLEHPVHMVFKGPRPRICPPTSRFPKLDVPSYFQDAYPLLIVSEESVVAVQNKVREMIGSQGVGEEWTERELEIERFRPNIVIKGAGAPFVEDIMTEMTVTSEKRVVDHETPLVHLVCKCTRCMLPNVDIVTGVRDNAVPFKTLMKFRRGLNPARANLCCLGCNGVFTEEGVMRVGDWVHVRKTGPV
ncbi:MOSC N-terminal beta barrel domain-containing protein [Pisolithus marmoratus]|nr:MOSC N-terminal beta barrel domain-containing protein [Pisolithus marmoratus]